MPPNRRRIVPPTHKYASSYYVYASINARLLTIQAISTAGSSRWRPAEHLSPQCQPQDYEYPNTVTPARA